MNPLQEWILMFLLERERVGHQTMGKDLFAASSSVTGKDVMRLVELGFVTIEQAKEISPLENGIRREFIIALTDKGRGYFSEIIPRTERCWK